MSCFSLLDKQGISRCVVLHEQVLWETDPYTALVICSDHQPFPCTGVLVWQRDVCGNTQPPFVRVSGKTQLLSRKSVMWFSYSKVVRSLARR